MSKTVVTLSFDDGREDTARVAYPIMKKYGLKSTLHVTTGFIDGSWKNHDWKSCDTPMSIQNIVDMHNDGFEISLHGDKHQTDKSDLMMAKNKLSSWGIPVETVGFSIPNSDLDETKKGEFIQFLIENKISYMRCGRNKKCYSFLSKICYGLYTFFNCKFCYNFFNQYNLNKKLDRYNLECVVVKNTDKADTIIDFIKKNVNGGWIILMLHSVLGVDDAKYNKDVWTWDIFEFDKLCGFLNYACDEGLIEVKTISENIDDKKVNIMQN